MFPLTSQNDTLQNNLERIEGSNHGFSFKFEFNYWPLPENLNLTRFHYGGDLTSYYVYKETFGIGLYLSQNRIHSLKDEHSLFAVGGEVEISFKRITKDFFLTPIFIQRIGHNKERFVKESFTTYNTYSQREGLNYAFKLGLRSNFSSTKKLQFGLTFGRTVYTEKLLKIFYSGQISTRQIGAHAVIMLGN